jgi:hypothetical protein
MARKIYLIVGVLVTVLIVGCTKDDISVLGSKGTEQGAPLSFDVAEVVETQTRSGNAGNIDYSVLSKSGYGFGVIAGEPLNWTNQQVTYSEGAGTDNPGSAFFYPSKWYYTGDVKYWVKDVNDAAVNFYAYAPYVASPAAGTGITAISGTDVSYAIDTDITNGVDLLWGVNGSTGLPWTNTTYTATGDGKQPTGGPVLFTFRHALAAIGFRTQVMINKENITTDFEDESAIAGVLKSEGGNYKVTIKKIELTGDFFPSGTLNLVNASANIPNWTSKTAATEQTLTVQNGQIVASMRHPHTNATTSETSNTGTNDTDGDDTNDSDAKNIMSSATITGVMQDAQQQVVLADGNGKEQCFFVIPSDARNYTLKLYWCVCAKLPNESTYIAEDHVAEIPISSQEFVAGRKYLLTFVIGLKLIGLTVTATDWNAENVSAQITVEHGTSASESLVKRKGGFTE